MHDFLAPEVEKKRDHKHTQTKNASNQVSLNFLQKTQQDISDLIEDFLADKNMSIEETFDELEWLKNNWKNNATTKVNLYETMNGGSIYLGDTTTLKIPEPGELIKKLVSLDQSLLTLANYHNTLHIPEEQLNFFTLKQRLRQLAPLRTTESMSKKYNSVIPIGEQLIEPKIDNKKEMISDPTLASPSSEQLKNAQPESLKKQEREVRPYMKKEVSTENLMSPKAILSLLIQSYGNTKGMNYDPDKIFHFLMKQGVRWRKNDFKPLFHGKGLSNYKFIKSSGVVRYRVSDYFKTDARHEFLSKVFDRPIDTIEEVTKVTKNSSYSQKKKRIKLDDLELQTVKDSIIESFGRQEDGTINIQKAEEFLLSKWSSWRATNFKIIYNGDNIWVPTIAKLFGIKKDHNKEYIKDEARYELLGKIFDKEFHLEVLNSEIAREKIIETYGEGDPQKALDFLKRQEWPRKNSQFKVNFKNKKIKIMAIFTLFGIQRNSSNEYYSDEARQEFLSVFFKIKKEDINKLYEKSCKKAVINKYGLVTSSTTDPQKALQFLLNKKIKWRKSKFSISPDGHEVKMIALAKIFGIEKQSFNDYYKEDTWHELLYKIFDVSP